MAFYKQSQGGAYGMRFDILTKVSLDVIIISMLLLLILMLIILFAGLIAWEQAWNKYRD